MLKDVLEQRNWICKKCFSRINIDHIINHSNNGSSEDWKLYKICCNEYIKTLENDLYEVLVIAINKGFIANGDKWSPLDEMEFVRE